MTERATGATPDQIEAAVGRYLDGTSWVQEYRERVTPLMVGEYRGYAANLVPPDHRIVAADRLARLVAAARVAVTMGSVGFLTATECAAIDALTDADMEG